MKNKDLTKDVAFLGATQKQQTLFSVEKQTEINGIEMGVLESGVPYLTGRGLEAMCGVAHSPFHRLTSNWQEEKTKPRGREIQRLLTESGYTESELYVRASRGGAEITAFTEPVCMALLEYFAFIADPPRPEAINAFRKLARVKFREFIYEAVGYSPEQKTLDSWKHFHDRMDMTTDSVEPGFFSVFREIASMIVPMIRSGIMISDKVVPDISVGRAWSSFWTEQELEKHFGERHHYNHEYPLYYPQAKSNPQPAYAYPDAVLPLFRQWLRENYINTKFPTYLTNQVKKDKLDKLTANKVIEVFAPKEIEQKPQ